MLTLVSFSVSWWVPVVRGTMAIVFGVLAFSLTVTTLAAVILAFGLYALADGLFSIAAAIANRTTTPDWWILLLQGVLGVGVGLACLGCAAATRRTAHSNENAHHTRGVRP